MTRNKRESAPILIPFFFALALTLTGCVPVIRHPQGKISDLAKSGGSGELNSFLDDGPNDPSGAGIRRNPNDPNLVKLENGDVIQVLGISVLTFTEGPPALALRYESGINAVNMKELREEADEIWKVFVEDVEAKHLTGAVLSATNTTPGKDGKRRMKGYRFVYTKDKNGVWHSADEAK